MISAKNISVSYNNTNVIQNLSFDIGLGDHACFFGPSGRGKSSLLKMLQGYLVPSTGYVKIKDMELNPVNIKNVRSLMAYIPQNINLPTDNGSELLKMMDASKRVEKVEYFINRLGMSLEMIESRFDEISGGQKQRIVIALCLSLDKEIVLFDEPTSSLDSNSIKKLLDVIKEDMKDKTVISASHNSEWINSASKKIYI